MTPPPRTLATDVLAGVTSAIESATGVRSHVARADPISGGCVNDAHVVTTGDGRRFFLKHNASAPVGLFEAEAAGLAALGARSALRVPAVLGHGATGGHAWLLLEHIPPGPPSRSYWTLLGSGLAALHAPGDRSPGFDQDNFIGPLPQSNETEADWADFWISRRLAPQLAQAFEAGLLNRNDPLWRALPDATRQILDPRASDGGTSLLHGDLWSGNVYPDGDGHPVLIDPAVYWGDSEVDLAMSELFGGFSAVFYAAYEDSRPLSDDYRRVRRDLYQLYPLLVHANLFGAGYAASATATARRILGR